MSDNKVTYEQQVAMGLVRRPNYVHARLAMQGEVLPPVKRLDETAINTVQHSLQVPLSATHNVEMKTSAVDRSQGFLIATVPLFAGLALGMVLVSVFFFNVPFLSLPALVIFWLTFVCAWLVAYIYTLAVSVEGIALFEARRKWGILEREQAERWNYYKQQGK